VRFRDILEVLDTFKNTSYTSVITNQGHFMNEKIITKPNSVKVIAQNYHDHINGKVLLKLKDSSNGFIAKFYPMTSTEQANYLCMDYSEAELLRLALNAMHEKENQE
jgi:hypothetical protein